MAWFPKGYVFGTTAEAWTAISSVATLFVALLTLGLLEFNRRMVQEMKADRLARDRPVILIDFVRDEDRIQLRIHNYGGPAGFVGVSFLPPLVNSQGVDIGRSATLEGSIPLIGPDQELRVDFDSYGGYFSVDYLLGKHQSRFTAMVVARDPSTDRLFETAFMYLNLELLGPVAKLGTVFAAELSDRDWDGIEHTAENVQRVKQIRVELADQLDDNSPGTALYLRGWRQFNDGQSWDTRSPRMVTVSLTGVLPNIAVYADSWSPEVSELLTFAKVVELDRLLTADLRIDEPASTSAMDRFFAWIKTALLRNCRS